MFQTIGVVSIILFTTASVIFFTNCELLVILSDMCLVMYSNSLNLTKILKYMHTYCITKTHVVASQQRKWVEFKFKKPVMLTPKPDFYFSNFFIDLNILGK